MPPEENFKQFATKTFEQGDLAVQMGRHMQLHNLLEDLDKQVTKIVRMKNAQDMA